VPFDPLLEATHDERAFGRAGYNLAYREFNAVITIRPGEKKLAAGLEWLFKLRVDRSADTVRAGLIAAALSISPVGLSEETGVFRL